jgi:methylmalonyl-CoA/ethylmalonyl-CoA epimerase
LFNRLDHVAFVTDNAEATLKIWCDLLGFKEVIREKVNNNSTLLVHIDLGNTHLQLVQPLTEEHPLHSWLKKHGPGFHHICLEVDHIDETASKLAEAGIRPGEQTAHQGTQGKRALFLDMATTGDVITELTGE